MDVGGALQDFGGAVSDIFGAIGSESAATAYKKAAGLATQNAAITKATTAVNVQQQQVQSYLTIGAEKAQTAGAGFQTGSGSAGDLLRFSAQQAALSKQLTEQQGEITQNAYQYQAQAYQGQASAAQTAAKGQGGGGILSAAAGIFSLFSDPRLKRDIMFVRMEGPYNIYHFRYLWSDIVYEGVMADQVQKIMSAAVTTIDGYLAVDYGMIGLKMVKVANA